MVRGFLFFVFVVFVFARTENLDGLAAIVQDEVVLKSEVWQQVSFVASSQSVDLYNNEEELSLLYDKVLGQIVDNLVLYDLAKKDSSLVLAELFIEEQLQKELSRQVGLVGSIKDLEKAYGEPLSVIRAKLRKQLRRTSLIEMFQSTLYPFASPSPENVSLFYKENEASFPVLGERVGFSVLEWPVTFQKEKEKEAFDFLLSLRDSVLLGESFALLASRHSDDIGSSGGGGSLGYTSRGTLFPEYEGAAFSLGVGEVSFPFRSPIGLHLVFLEDRLGEKIKTSHILKSLSISAVDIKNSKDSLASFLGELNVYNSVDVFDSLCVHHKVGQAVFQGVFNGFYVSDLPAFLTKVSLDSSGFSPLLLDGEKLYVARFFQKKPEETVSLQNSYYNLYTMTQNDLLINKLNALINNHAQKIYIQKFY